MINGLPIFAFKERSIKNWSILLSAAYHYN